MKDSMKTIKANVCNKDKILIIVIEWQIRV